MKATKLADAISVFNPREPLIGDRQLKPENYPVLAARRADKRLSSQPEVQELLHGLALLEYANDEPWCDVHPVVWPVVQARVGA